MIDLDRDSAEMLSRVDPAAFRRAVYLLFEMSRMDASFALEFVGELEGDDPDSDPPGGAMMPRNLRYRFVRLVHTLDMPTEDNMPVPRRMRIAALANFLNPSAASTLLLATGIVRRSHDRV